MKIHEYQARQLLAKAGGDVTLLVVAFDSPSSCMGKRCSSNLHDDSQ